MTTIFKYVVDLRDTEDGPVVDTMLIEQGVLNASAAMLTAEDRLRASGSSLVAHGIELLEWSPLLP